MCHSLMGMPLWEHMKDFPTLQINPSRMVSISRKKASELFPLVPDEMLGPVSFPEGKQNLMAAGDSQTHHLPFKGQPSLGREQSWSWGKQRQELLVPVIWSQGGLMVFLGSGIFPWHERWKSCDLHHFPPSRPAHSVCSRPRVQKQLLAPGRGTRWMLPGMTQISGRSPLAPSRRKGLRVDRAECHLGYPSRIPPTPAVVAAAWSRVLASPRASHTSQGSICVFFSSLGDAPPGLLEKPEAWAGRPSIHRP